MNTTVSILNHPHLQLTQGRKKIQSKGALRVNNDARRCLLHLFAPIPEAASTSRDLKTLRAMMFSIYPLDEHEPTSVDCTLSLGTPSTRLAGGEHYPRASLLPPWSSTSCMSSTLVERRCANCDTTSTPLWRKGPRGPRSLCNACGIRFKKEERKMSTLSLKQGFPATTVGHEHISHQKQSLVVSGGLPIPLFLGQC